MVSLDNKFEIDEAFRNKVEGLVEDILVSAHGKGAKARIKKMHNRLNFACPYCGDSSTDMLKKRGNLFWDTLYYHCYNYGCNIHKSVSELINDYIPNGLNSTERIGVIDYIKSHSRKTVRQSVRYEIFENLYKLAVPLDLFMERTGTKKINENSPGYEYLKNRLLVRSADGFTYGNNKLYILNLTNDRKRVVGFQMRNLGRSGSKYQTYNIEKLYGFCGLELPEGSEVEKLNDVSTLFGILDIDFTRPVTIFEGPIDAKFMGNSLALCTVGRNVEQFQDIPTIRYMFDNDKAGKNAMRDLLKTGKEVFLWSKFISTFNLNEFEIKDLNDLILICYKNKLDAYKYIGSYFSSNSLDSFYI